MQIYSLVQVEITVEIAKQQVRWRIALEESFISSAQIPSTFRPVSSVTISTITHVTQPIRVLVFKSC